MGLERIKPSGPLGAIRREPRVQFHQRLGPQSVEAPLGVAADLHEPGVAQDLQVTGHAGLMHPDRPDQLADGPLTVTDGVEDPPACWFGDHLEHLKHCDVTNHGLII